jgi:lipoate-protein ligase A
MNHSTAQWRLIKDSPARGSWNMAVDEAILGSVGAGESPPTLRLYAWEPPCLSLGFAQPVGDVDREGLRANGWDLVRRPTGGRAILHTDELTYAVIAPHSEPRLAGGILESYQRLSVALLHALESLGLPAESKQNPEARSPADQIGSNENSTDPICFEVPSNYEITVHGKKLVGSAQARKREGILQHGSLPLYGDLTRIAFGLVFRDGNERSSAGDRLLKRATTVESVTGYRITWESAAQAFAVAFKETLNLDLVPGSLTAFESAHARDLVDAKYANPAWTDRV